MKNDSRIENILQQITELMAGNHQFKIKRSPQHDELDAIIVGLNMLAEELEATTFSKDYVDSILQSMADALMVVNLNATIRTINQSALELLGYQEHELLGKPINNLFESNGTPTLFRVSQIEKLLKTGFLRNAEIVCLSKKGKRIDGLLSGAVLRNEEGAPQGIVCVVHDITERKQVETRLQNSEKRIRSIMDTVISGIITIDEHGIIDSFNLAAERLFGYPSQEAIGQNISILMPEPHRSNHDKYLKRYLNTGQKNILGLGRETTGQRKDGTTFPIYIEVSEIQLENQRLFTGVIHDLSEQKKVEQELLIAKEQAESANLAKSLFLANMSHEIRTPLGAIVGFAQILLRRAKSQNLPDSFLKLLENIQTAGHDLTDLINSILDLSKIESGKMEVNEDVLNVKQLIQSLYHLNKEKAEEKGVRLSFSFGTNLVERIQSDRGKLNQILINLVGNAIKFTPPGKSIEIYVGQTHDALVLKVIDQGLGIEPDKLDTIFERFEQADNTTARHFGGTGLGLTITKSLAFLLGGNIWVESTLGEGSTFFVQLPLKLPKDPENTSLAEESLSLADFKEKCILLVEDNLMNREMMIHLFEDIGINYILAENGGQGLQKTLDFEPDLILMDMHLPGMTGLECTKKIRLHPELQHIPIIGLSADAFINQQQEALSAGVVEYLKKPVDLDTLLSTLNSYLNKSIT